MQPPIVGQTVLGWDPAFRTGCKLAVVRPHRKGDRIPRLSIPTAPTTPKKIQASKDLLKKIIRKISCNPDFSWKWDGFPGIRTVYRRTVKRDSSEGAVRDRQ